jgi:hypothetical protein
MEQLKTINHKKVEWVIVTDHQGCADYPRLNPNIVQRSITIMVSDLRVGGDMRMIDDCILNANGICVRNIITGRHELLAEIDNLQLEAWTYDRPLYGFPWKKMNVIQGYENECDADELYNVNERIVDNSKPCDKDKTLKQPTPMPKKGA